MGPVVNVSDFYQHFVEPPELILYFLPAAGGAHCEPWLEPGPADRGLQLMLPPGPPLRPRSVRHTAQLLSLGSLGPAASASMPHSDCPTLAWDFATPFLTALLCPRPWDLIPQGVAPPRGSLEHMDVTTDPATKPRPSELGSGACSSAAITSAPSSSTSTSLSRHPGRTHGESRVPLELRG